MRKTLNVLTAFILVFSIFVSTASAAGTTTTDTTSAGTATTDTTSTGTATTTDTTSTGTATTADTTSAGTATTTDTSTTPVDNSTSSTTTSTTSSQFTPSGSTSSTTTTGAQTPSASTPTQSVPSVPSATTQGVTTTTTATETKPVDDGSNLVDKNGIHVSVGYSEDEGAVGYIPNFTLVLRNKDGKIFGTMLGSKANYDSGKKSYELAFNVPDGYKSGDEFQLYLKQADSIIKSLNVKMSHFDGENYVTETAKMTPNTFYSFKISVVDVDSADGSATEKELSPSSLVPIESTLVTDNTKVGFYLVDKVGNPLANRSLKVKLDENKGILSLKTNSIGVAWVGTSSLTDMFRIYLDDLKVQGTDGNILDMTLPVWLVAGTSSQTSAITYVIATDGLVENTDAESTSLAINQKLQGNTDLSNNWAEYNLTFTSSNGEKMDFSLSSDSKAISGLSNGTYSVTATSKHANVSIPSTVTISNGKGSLNVTLSSKYTLRVDKNNKAYNFTVINADKTYKGSTQQDFAVAPGESYMVKDNESGEVYSVAIDEQSPLTRLVLGQGVVFGGDSTAPHTGDIILILLALLALALVGSGVSYYLYKKRKNSGLKLTVVSILALTLLGSQITPISVKADGVTIIPGSPSSVSSGSQSPSGVIQTSETVSVLQIGVIPTKASGAKNLLTKDSSYSDFEDSYKFNPKYAAGFFYMAPNASTEAIFKQPNTAVVSYSGGTTYLQYGDVHPLFKGSGARPYAGSKAELNKRLLPSAENAINSGNAFESFVGNAIMYMGGNPNGRELWAGKKSSSSHAIGSILDPSYKKWLDSRSPKPTWYKNGDVDTGLILDGYIAKLKSIGQTAYANDLASKLASASKEDYVIFTQIMPSFYASGTSGANRAHAFLTMHDAADWYLYGMKGSRNGRVDAVSPSYEAKIVHNLTWNGARLSDGRFDSGFAKITPSSTFAFNARETTGTAMKPKSSKVGTRSNGGTDSASLNDNPFLGWGFIPWTGGFFAKLPTIEASYEVTVVDGNGNPTGEKVTREVPSWGSNSYRSLLYLSANDTIKFSTEPFVQNGKLYTIKTGVNAPISIVDKLDGENLLKIDGKNRTGAVPVPNPFYNGDTAVEFGFDIPKIRDLHVHLGGDPVPSSAGVKDKWADPNKFSDAKVTIYLKATVESVAVITKGQAKGTAPQWSLSQYSPEITGGNPATSLFYAVNLNNAVYTAYVNRILNPYKYLTFFFDSKMSDGMSSWAKTKAVSLSGSYKEVGKVDLVVPFKLSGSILAIKSSTVDNIKLASWKNNQSILGGAITSAVKGSVGSYTSKVEQGALTYTPISPVNKFVASVAKVKCYEDSSKSKQLEYWNPINNKYANGSGGSNGWANTKCGTGNTYTDIDFTDVLHLDLYTAVAPAIYGYGMTFYRYIPSEGHAPTTYEKAKDSQNGSYTETLQSSQTLKVNPEVAMSYDDEAGRKSVVFTAGDRLRSIKPLNVNSANFVNVAIKPTDMGMSTATDTKAKALASSLGSTGKPVIYKGSAITSNFEVNGNLELKTFALDIANQGLKNAWGNNAYSTDVVNADFLKRYATWNNNTNKWEVTFNSNSKLKINGVAYGGVNSNLKATQKSTSIVEHKLVVRGGKLVSVDGNSNLNSLPTALKDAIAKMKISGNGEIFNNFERGTGSALTDATVANLMSAVRGVGVSVGNGWYNEDTTTLVVREYTNVFTLPQVVAVDKVPMQIPGLEEPINKALYFSKGYTAGNVLKLTVADAFMEYDSSLPKPFGGLSNKSYIVPNVSVMDSYQ